MPARGRGPHHTRPDPDPLRAHGLLSFDRVITPYELRMGQPGSISPDALPRQAEELHLADEPRVIVLAGRAYATAALAVWPTAATPLAWLMIPASVGADERGR